MSLGGITTCLICWNCFPKSLESRIVLAGFDTPTDSIASSITSSSKLNHILLSQSSNSGTQTLGVSSKAFLSAKTTQYLQTRERNESARPNQYSFVSGSIIPIAIPPRPTSWVRCKIYTFAKLRTTPGSRPNKCFGIIIYVGLALSFWRLISCPTFKVGRLENNCSGIVKPDFLCLPCSRFYTR